MIKSNFSVRLAELLTMTGDSMRDLAQKCDIPYSTIRGYVAGDSVPNGIEQVQKIARATGLSSAWLLGEDVSQTDDECCIKRDLQLMMTLAEFLSDAQRSIVIKQMLNALLQQVENARGSDGREVMSLPVPVIELALELNKLSVDKQRAIRREYLLDEKGLGD
ncbi:Helix-turn-helix [Cedecea neteri]|uniref:Helix-turn-helix n=1 Tax=Cedecea neteri TaxID=158822 RepID=A0A291E638_9ENTR|nr:helix-turn-helix transcriptional regulator [Cedecea neteri]ATF95497.1 XRE family transcriptional regulator [Cedecea neteri]SQC92065.1 Helix-turn-helix [Cedecea neteri]